MAAHKLASKRRGEDLVFGRTEVLPFIPSTVRARALKAWKAAGLEPITAHEARHSAASYLIEAGLNDLELTSMIGHSDPRTTKMIYGHLFPDSREKVAAKLDAYLEAAESIGAAR
jgi:integrase